MVLDRFLGGGASKLIGGLGGSQIKPFGSGEARAGLLAQPPKGLNPFQRKYFTSDFFTSVVTNTQNVYVSLGTVTIGAQQVGAIGYANKNDNTIGRARVSLRTGAAATINARIRILAESAQSTATRVVFEENSRALDASSSVDQTLLYPVEERGPWVPEDGLFRMQLRDEDGASVVSTTNTTILIPATLYQ